MTKTVKLNNKDRAEIFNAARMAIIEPLQQMFTKGSHYWAQRLMAEWLDPTEHEFLMTLQDTGRSDWLHAVGGFEVFLGDKGITVPSTTKILEIFKSTGAGWASYQFSSDGAESAIAAAERGAVVNRHLLNGRSPKLEQSQRVPFYLLYTIGSMRIGDTIEYSKGPKELQAGRVRRARPVIKAFSEWSERQGAVFQEAILQLSDLRTIVDNLTSDVQAEKLWPEGERYWRPVVLEKMKESHNRRMLPAATGDGGFTELRQRVSKAMKLEPVKPARKRKVVS